MYNLTNKNNSNNNSYRKVRDGLYLISINQTLSFKK